MWKDKVFEIRIDNELLKKAKMIAKKRRCSTSEFIRKAIVDFLEENKKLTSSK